MDIELNKKQLAWLLRMHNNNEWRKKHPMSAISIKTIINAGEYREHNGDYLNWISSEYVKFIKINNETN